MGIINDFMTKVRLIAHVIKSGSSNYSKLFEMGNELNLYGDTVTDPYSQISSVYKAIKAIADNVPQAEMKLYRRGTMDEVQDDRISALLEAPNPLMTGNDFLQALVGFYGLYGEIFIAKTNSMGQITGRGANLPAELWAYNPIKANEVIEEGILKGWKYNNQFFTTDEVVFQRDFNPNSTLRGVAPTKVIKNIMDVDYKALMFNKKFFDNNATPGMILSTEKNLSDIQIERLRAQHDKMHSGFSKAFKTAIFEGGIEPKFLSSNHKDMEFLQQQRFTREEILGIWKVPKALFNITDDLNYATFQGQIRAFWLYGIMPILRKLESALTVNLIKPYRADIVLRFDIRNVPAFKEQFKEEVQTAKELYAMGFTGNELNERFQWGFEEKEWREHFYIPFSSRPADEELPDPIPYEAPKDDDKKDEKKDDKKSVSNIVVTDNGEKIWKLFLNGHTPIEQRFEKKLKRFFWEQRNLILAQVNEKIRDANKAYQKKEATILYDVNWDKESQKLNQYVDEYIRLGVKHGIDMASELSGVAVDHELLKTAVSSYMRNMSDTITAINKTIKRQLDDELLKRLAEAIDSGIIEGETITQIAEGVKHVYNKAGNRAMTIARTTTTGTVNGGSQLFYDEMDVPYKRWITAGDEAVRESHTQINGLKIRTNETFPNGLMYPGHGDGNPGDICNCRCTVTPEY